MKEKASDAKVKFLGGHVEALVKETISCGVSRGEVIELFLTYWEKEQKKILESKEQLKKRERKNSFIPNGRIYQKCHSAKCLQV